MDSRAEAIRRSFDRHAPRYGRNPFTAWVGRSELATLRALIPPASQPGLTPALDFGCGTGRATRLLLACGYRVTGYDLSSEMLAQAQADLGQSDRVSFTLNRSELPTGWPLIVSLGVLDYYPDSLSLWQEWRRLLAPSGLLLVTAPNAASPLAWLYALVSRLTCRAYPASLDQLTQTLNQAGLTLIEKRAAFPNHPRLGHTLVLSLRPSARGEQSF